MRKDAPAFMELEKTILENQVRKRDIADGINITPEALSRKLTGKVDFTLKEIKYLHKLFPDIPVEKLFNMDE